MLTDEDDLLRRQPRHLRARQPEFGDVDLSRRCDLDDQLTPSRFVDGLLQLHSPTTLRRSFFLVSGIRRIHGGPRGSDARGTATTATRATRG
ncbi:MAG: hypothetical protein R3B82_24405 [Sandaracinaceae bacterium]